MAVIRRTLRTYRFLDKDPVKDELQTMLQDVGLMERLGIVATLANVSHQTLTNLFHGDTKRPQNATVMGIVTAVGYERRFVRARKLNVEKELEVAREFNRKEAKRVERANARAGSGKKRRPRGKKQVTHLRLVKSA